MVGAKTERTGKGIGDSIHSTRDMGNVTGELEDVG